jgi:hypothetical protein
MSLRQCGAAARYGIPGAMVGLALAWALGGQRGVQAQGAGPAGIDRPRPVMTGTVGESGGTLAMIAPLQQGAPGSTTQLLYLIDTKSLAFAVYRIDPTHPKGTIKLEGVRQCRYDLKLQHYNNQDPDVASIEAAVRAAGAQAR